VQLIYFVSEILETVENLCCCSVHNTLYVNVHCPTIRPDIVVISNSSDTTIDFSDVAVGQRVVKSVTMQNISDSPVEVSHRFKEYCFECQFLPAFSRVEPVRSRSPEKFPIMWNCC
jgi:hypothetical protein